MKLTIKQISVNTNISPKLIRAVIKQSGGLASFIDIAPDIVNHGISGGFNGWIYYTETMTFTLRNKKEIITLLQEQCQDIYGHTNIIEFVKGFNCLNNDFSVSEIAQVLYGKYSDEGDNRIIYNALAWYTCEEVARVVADMIGEG